MKKSFVFVPAVLVAVFLLNSFVLNKREKTIEGAKSLSGAPVAKAAAKKAAPGTIVYQSADGGKTWQDISKGLPERLQREGVQRDGFFANDRGLYVRAGNGLYHTDPGATAPVWTKESFPGNHRNITPGKNGIIAYNFRGQFLKKINGTNEWSPMYTSFQEQAVRLNGTIDWMYTNFHEKQVSSVFETAKGTVLVGSNNAIYRSNNSGKAWKYVRVGGWIMKVIESEGVLLAASTKGILRSTDDGENWERVISEGSIGNAVERINGGFAAVAYNSITRTNRIYISVDNGKTWSASAGPQPSWKMASIQQIGRPQPEVYISSIKQAVNYLICGRSDGVFRSSDMGKTWKLLLRSKENRGFDLFVSGNVIYAIPNKGC